MRTEDPHAAREEFDPETKAINEHDIALLSDLNKPRLFFSMGEVAQEARRPVFRDLCLHEELAEGRCRVPIPAISSVGTAAYTYYTRVHAVFKGDKLQHIHLDQAHLCRDRADLDLGGEPFCIDDPDWVCFIGRDRFGSGLWQVGCLRAREANSRLGSDMRVDHSTHRTEPTPTDADQVRDAELSDTRRGHDTPTTQL